MMFSDDKVWKYNSSPSCSHKHYKLNTRLYVRAFVTFFFVTSDQICELNVMSTFSFVSLKAYMFVFVYICFANSRNLTDFGASLE